MTRGTSFNVSGDGKAGASGQSGFQINAIFALSRGIGSYMSFVATTATTAPTWDEFRRVPDKTPTTASFPNNPQVILDNSPIAADIGYSYGYPIDTNNIYLPCTLASTGDTIIGAFSRETGDLVWETVLDSVLSIARIDDSLLVLSNFSTTFGWLIDRTDGSIISQVNLGGGGATPSAITPYNGFFYAGRDDSSFTFGRLAKIDPSDGSIVNTFDIDNSLGFADSLTISDGTMYIRDGRQIIRALDVESLTEIYSNDHGTDLFSPRSCYSDGVIYTGLDSGPGWGTAISDADGSIIWQKSTSAADLPWEINQTMEPTVTDKGLAYIARTTESSPDGRFICLDPDNGDVIFTLGPGDGFNHETGFNGEYWGVYSEDNNTVITSVDNTGEVFYGINMTNESVFWSRSLPTTGSSSPTTLPGVAAPESADGESQLYTPYTLDGDLHIRKFGG